MTECLILIGLPASGKSSFYRERFGRTHDHVSKDLLGSARSPARRQAQLISESLSHGRSVVVDNTNPTAAVRAPLIALARAHDATVTAYYFPTEVADALRRNQGREGRARVPDVAIYTIRKQLEAPLPSEGFDEIFTVRLDEEAGTFEVEPYAK
jgi:predicted kinase